MDNRRISCNWSYSEIVNYGIQQNHVPVVRRIEIHNHTEEDLANFTVRITAEPDFAYEWSKSYGLLPAGQSLNLGTINLQMSASFLANLSERLTGTITLQVLQGDSEVCLERGTITVLAFDEWSGLAVLPELTAAFVMPNHHPIAQVVREAADILAKWTGSSSFSAYQSKDPNKVRTQAAAIYAALQNRKIAYNVAPPSFEVIGQRVRLPETIFAHRMGNCLDLSLLYAACLEAVGLHPLLVFTKGHAFTGLWLEEETFAESVQDDISVLTKRIAIGMNQICVVEATAFVEGETASFDQAVALAEKHLQDPDQFDCVLDIRRARAAAVRPLPIRTATPEGWIVEPQAAPGETDAAAPELVDVFEKPLEVDALSQSPRQKLWERRLLDLTLRNSLLNFRLSKSSIPVITAQLGDLEDALADGEEFQLLAKPNDWQNNGRNADLYQSVNNDHPLAQLLREEFNRKRLRVDLDAVELERRMVHLYRSARVSLEENGANTLYLALGLLKWYETPVSELPRYAPIALIPVDIIRKSSRQGYVIRARDEEPQMNITLLEMLKQDYGIGIEGLDPLPRDEKGIALRQVFHVFRHALIQVPRWDVEESAYLGLFSFGQFVMWNDIRTHADKLARNKIVASLMEGRLKWEEPAEETTPLDLDHPTRLSVPISADSSQLTAVRAAAGGQSFVLHGPPGTGKSQTITNMIAGALAQGKRVLFVAEKMAALSVVQRRLEQIGLGPFCLELHSNKSTKKSVLDQLAAAIEAKKIPAPEAWSSQADRLFQLRNELNGYVSALHHKYPFGMTLFEAIAGYEQAGEAPAVVHFDDASIDALTPEKLILWKDLAARLQIAGADCGEPHLHPLSDAELTTYSQAVKSEADQALKRYIPLLAQLREAISQAAARLKLDADRIDGQRLQVLVQLCELASRVPNGIKPAFLQAADVEEAVAQVRATAEQGRHRDQLRAKVFTKFTSEVTQIDARSILSEWDRTELQWFLPKWSGQKRIIKRLKGLAANAASFSKDQVKPALVELTAWQEEELKLKTMKTAAAPYLGQAWADAEDGKWEELAAACDWVEKLQATLVQWSGSRTAAQSSRQQMTDVLLDGRHDQAQITLLQGIGGLVERIKVEELELGRLLIIPFEKLRTSEEAGEWLAFIADKAKQWSAHIDRLREWTTWRRVRDEAAEAGLLPLIAPYEEGQVSNAQLIAAYERGLYRSIANYMIARDKSLLAFSGKLFEDTIERFRAADQHYLSLTQQEIAARLSAKIPQMTVEAAQSSEAGILQRAIRSGGRNLSIRKLFESIPNLLPRLTPCMLMSPISVAQYLDPNGAKFDLVIFDEASQVPTAQAVGALARGHQAVIVGDPKQLPPTSFFSKNASDTDEEEALQDMESILDDCLALGMPERHLTWHYRSRHESLIAFSNAHYYENKLMTFPSPDEPVSSLTFIPIEGYYDRGRSKQNRAEGEAVVAEMIRRVKDPVLRQRSIGVVTFSSVQQTLIEDLLEEAMKQDQELDLLFAQLPEPVFVKNLENVQGDERDVILFSVGYGPDASGKVNLNFGPLNRQGGWRRLNVAVSRARYEMLVYSTLMSHHLNASRISAQGVLGLKAFLEYAEKGRRALPASSASEQVALVSNLHRSLAEELKVLGYETEQHVGASGYRIDLGVLDPVNKGQYVLGILLDGPMYRDAEAARDRDLLREQVLEQLGWKLVRVWSPEWWENKGHLIRQVVAAIEQAKERTPVTELPTAPSEPIATILSEPASADGAPETFEEPAYVDPPSKSDTITYAASQLEPVSLGTDMFYSPASTELILGQIRQVIREEGPISRSLLAKRVLQAWGITRLGAKLDQRLADLIIRLKPLETVSDGAVFYWPEGSEPSRYDRFRVATEEARRTAEELPAEEAAAAVKAVLAAQISLPQEDLIKQVVKLLGYARSGNALDRVIRNGIQKAIELDYVQADEQDRIVLK